MKFKALILGLCVGFCATAIGANQQFHPDATSEEKQELKWLGYCEIEIVNDSFEDLRVYGTYDNGFSMLPFYIFSFEAPHYISLYYYGYCHRGMNLYIDTLHGWPLYAGYTPVGMTIVLSSGYGKHATVKLQPNK